MLLVKEVIVDSTNLTTALKCLLQVALWVQKCGKVRLTTIATVVGNLPIFFVRVDQALREEL